MILLFRECFVNLVHPCLSCSPRSWTPLPCSLWTVFLLLSSLTPTGVATCTGGTWRESCSPLGSGSVQSRCLLLYPLRPPQMASPGAYACTGLPWVAQGACMSQGRGLPLLVSGYFRCVFSVGQTAGQQGGDPEHLPVPQPSVQPPGGYRRRASRGGALRCVLRSALQPSQEDGQGRLLSPPENLSLNLHGPF